LTLSTIFTKFLKRVGQLHSLRHKNKICVEQVCCFFSRVCRIQLEPENLDVMFKMGMQYLRNNSEDPAFAMFGKALSYQSSHQQSILAAGSIMQAHGDHDVALNKYRVAVEGCDYNGCLWNNIGICLFAKGRLAQAHSCLKKASFICPLDYKINYNLGLVHQAMGLHCSALHFLKAAAELKRDNAQIIGAMAVVLSNMNDINNARRAYEKSISMEPKAEVVSFLIEIVKYKNVNLILVLMRSGCLEEEVARRMQEGLRQN
uniref:TPR_REGION domain-containing protein n=1 Tax=Haemonchus placei TaxID=6290 RepID=A0A0N4WD97_HAEPC